MATVNSNGLVTAVGVGTVSITATSETKSGSASLTVSVVPVETVAVTLAPSSIYIGQTTQASAVTKDASGNTLVGRTIAWTSSSSSVATVNSNGLVTAVGVGTVSITATSETKSGSAPLTVSVVPVETVAVTLASSSIYVGQTTQASAVTKDASGNTLAGRTIAWTSSSSSVATVNSNGLVTAVGVGTVSITATSETKSGSASLTVSVVPVETVAVTLASSSIYVGQSTQASAILKDASGNTLVGRTIAWTSSSSSVATVNSNGLVTAVGFGSASVVASSDGKIGSADVSVPEVIAEWDLETWTVPAPNSLAISADLNPYVLNPRNAEEELLGYFHAQGGFPPDQVLSLTFPIVTLTVNGPNDVTRTAPDMDMASIVPCTGAQAPGNCNFFVFDALAPADQEFPAFAVGKTPGTSRMTLTATPTAGGAPPPGARAASTSTRCGAVRAASRPQLRSRCSPPRRPTPLSSGNPAISSAPPRAPTAR